MSTKRSAKPAPASDPVLEQASKQVLDLLMSGGTIGEYLGHSRESMDGLYMLGYSLYNQGKYAEAEKAFGALLICNHTDRRIYQSYAACLHMQQRHVEAIRYYAMAAAMDVNDPAPPFYCAECLLSMGKREEAIASLNHVLGIPPRSSDEEALHERALGLLDLVSPPAASTKGEASAPADSAPSL